MEQSFIKQCLLKYKNLISLGTGINDNNYERSDIAYWRDVLFISLLQYCLPISLITILPGILLANLGRPIAGFYIDFFVFLVLALVTFARTLKLRWRKFIIVSLFYSLSIYQISITGYNGLGMFYLLAITVLIVLILPIRFAYWSVLVSALILGSFAIKSYVMPSAGRGTYLLHQLFIFSFSLLFVQLTLVALIDKIFNLLQITIHTKDKLKENYLRIFDASPIPMWVFEIETLRFLAVNDAAVIQYGYTKGEFLASTIQVLRPEEHQREISNLVLSNQDQINFKKDAVMHLTKDGQTLFVNIESRLLTYKGRKAKLVLATNITAQIEAEKVIYESVLKIKQSEANLQAIFNSTTEGFLLLDENYRIISFNEKALKTVFLNKNNLSFIAGKSIFDYVDESREMQVRQNLDAAIRGSVVQYEREFIIDGTKIWMHYTIMAVDQDGLRKGICINGREITDYKTYVQTIESQNAKLREISWNQSHMVRAPLARIMGLNALIKTCNEVEEREELLHFLDQSCLELDTVVRKIVIETEHHGANIGSVQGADRDDSLM